MRNKGTYTRIFLTLSIVIVLCWVGVRGGISYAAHSSDTLVPPTVRMRIGTGSKLEVLRPCCAAQSAAAYNFSFMWTEDLQQEFYNNVYLCGFLTSIRLFLQARPILVEVGMEKGEGGPRQGVR